MMEATTNELYAIMSPAFLDLPVTVLLNSRIMSSFYSNSFNPKVIISRTLMFLLLGLTLKRGLDVCGE